MSRPVRFSAADCDAWLTMIAEMSRDDLVLQFRSYPAPFPIDFTDEFLASHSLDRLRHIFAGLVLHCGIAPRTGTCERALAA